MESIGQFQHLYSTMHHGKNNAIRSLIIIPCRSMPDGNDHERGNLEGEATNQSKRKPNLVNTVFFFVMEQPLSHYMCSLLLIWMR